MSSIKRVNIKTIITKLLNLEQVYFWNIHRFYNFWNSKLLQAQAKNIELAVSKTTI